MGRIARRSPVSSAAAGVAAASQAEHELAATDGATAIENKAATPKGLYWFWEKVKTLNQTFTAIITFSQAWIVTAFAGVGERLLSTDNTGTVLNAYQLAEEFTAVPPTLASAGIPGQKAYSAPYLYYCVAANTWIRFLAEGNELQIADQYTAIPPTPTSSGLQGQRAYDSTNSLMYECVAANVWIRYTIVKTW